MNKPYMQQGVRSEGFTLVESLIAIAILVTAVLAPLAIAQSGIQGARYAQQQVTATFLAQEAVELVKYQVAYNLNNGADATNWLEGLDGSNGSVDCVLADCEITGPRNGNQAVIRECSDNTNSPITPCRVYLNTNTNFYRSAAASNTVVTPYTRAIRVSDAGIGAKVIVTVSWTANSGLKTYTVEDYVYRWR